MKQKHLTMLGLLAALSWLAACGQEDPARFQGYVEGDYLLIAPEHSGRIDRVFAAQGQTVEKGAPLYAMDDEEMAARRAEAAARLAAAEARLSDLRASVQRPEEIEVLDARIEEARASLEEAEKALARTRRLVAEGNASQSALDAAVAAHERARAALVARRRERDAARLPARSARIEAAMQEAEAARAALRRAEWRLRQTRIEAPAAGYIEDIIRYPGETAGPEAPVISLLPPENRFIRFFVPEALRSRIELGQTVSIDCDGCPDGLSATVFFIASEAEFTPPVIFSVRSRQKLVYMIEARPDRAAGRLYPGQPVDVRLAGEAP